MAEISSEDLDALINDAFGVEVESYYPPEYGEYDFWRGPTDYDSGDDEGDSTVSTYYLRDGTVLGVYTSPAGWYAVGPNEATWHTKNGQPLSPSQMTEAHRKNASAAVMRSDLPDWKKEFWAEAFSIQSKPRPQQLYEVLVVPPSDGKMPYLTKMWDYRGDRQQLVMKDRSGYFSQGGRGVVLVDGNAFDAYILKPVDDHKSVDFDQSIQLAIESIGAYVKEHQTI